MQNVPSVNLGIYIPSIYATLSVLSAFVCLSEGSASVSDFHSTEKTAASVDPCSCSLSSEVHASSFYQKLAGY